MPRPHRAERQRLAEQRLARGNWRLWGPYLAERAWGTVREDYSERGDAWAYFDHDQARSRAYRWSEDGLAGLCDEQQRLCFAVALWNGQDPILKERAFGLTGKEGNHGEDVKECYFYRDATPSHSWLRYAYKYPQSPFPYEWLVRENGRRGVGDPAFSLLDTGVFEGEQYWDVDVCYAKAGPDRVHCRITLHNRAVESAVVHVLPTLWFRNTWSWGEPGPKPVLRRDRAPAGAEWAIRAEHPTLGRYYLYGAAPGEVLFTDNESHGQRLWDGPSVSPHVKDAFHRRVIHGELEAVRSEGFGTKSAVWSSHEVDGGQAIWLDLVLSEQALRQPFADHESVLTEREGEADAFFEQLLPSGTHEDRSIVRQALAGMVWNQQFYHYDVARWLRGDQPPPPKPRKYGRNRHWRHLRAADVISMPDTWEYPWFAAWDLAYHVGALALLDVDFAKQQVELVLRERYLHPNGQIPAYEWNFEDVNPPVHAMAALEAYRAERAQHGREDRDFLQRVFHKLLLNFAWWINRKDSAGHNLFEGGFLGLDNISVYDRSQPLPDGFQLKQADATGWMAMFSLNMAVIALELCVEDPDYEDMAVQCYGQFLAIANAIAGSEETGLPALWDERDGYFKDVVVTPEGQARHIDVYSWVGLIPLFATEIVDSRLLSNAPRFRALLHEHRGGLFRGSHVCACPDTENERGQRLLALVDHSRLPRILERVLDEAQLLSPYGVRSVSRLHAERTDLGQIPGIGHALIEYVPGESNSRMFGGNSNWRGPVWIPTNYSLVQALDKFYRFVGPAFEVAVPCLGGQRRNLREVAELLCNRLLGLYRRGGDGSIPALRGEEELLRGPEGAPLCWFYEYFHGDTGKGLGAAHQTGWTGLVAALALRVHAAEPGAYTAPALGETPPSRPE